MSAGLFVKGRWFLPGDGHETRPVTAKRIARWWPWDLPIRVWTPTAGLGSFQRVHSLADECLGEAGVIAAGLKHVGVVEKPVDGRGCQRFGHSLVEPRRSSIRLHLRAFAQFDRNSVLLVFAGRSLQLPPRYGRTAERLEGVVMTERKQVWFLTGSQSLHGGEVLAHRRLGMGF